MINDTLKNLRALSTVPSREGGAYDRWLEQTDAFAFLVDSLSVDDFVVYASLPHAFIHAVLVPSKLVSPPDIDDLMSWNHNPYSLWGVTYSFSDPPDATISSPLDIAGSEALKKGEQLVFCRSFEGNRLSAPYIEVLQKFAHIFNLPFVAERNAYCRLDPHGDIEDVVQIRHIDAEGEFRGGTVVTFDRRLLDEYAALNESVVVRMFDFTRYEPGQFEGWDKNRTTEEARVDNDDLFYRIRIDHGYASYSRGCQIIRTEDTRQAIIKRFQKRLEGEEKQYATFIAFNWKTDQAEEISCNPANLSNYFTESDLPFDTSPAFFRPEVLIKYKGDRDKYKFGDRSITCHGTWTLPTYDINEAGQVHTYLKYLGDLPYEEQLQWKQYNEAPKAPISKRAYTTDIKGEFFEEYDALSSLKRKLLGLHERAVPWWTLRSEELIHRTHYPVTSSADEWEDEILSLDKLLVEGFQERWLRKKAKELGRSPEPKFRSLKLIEECLIGIDFEEDHARSITAPLRNTSYLRNKLKAHASSSEAASIRSDAISDHGSYRNHFENLCKICDEAMETIIEAFQDSRMS